MHSVLYKGRLEVDFVLFKPQLEIQLFPNFHNDALSTPYTARDAFLYSGDIQRKYICWKPSSEDEGVNPPRMGLKIILHTHHLTFAELH